LCLGPAIRGDLGRVADRWARRDDRPHARPRPPAARSMTTDGLAVETPPTDDTDWDRFVESADPGSYLQLSGWARVKAVNGWSAERIQVAGPAPIAAQILTRRPRPLPWAFAY